MNFIYPPVCINCGNEILEGLVCNDCLNLIIYPKPPLCPICGRPIDKKKTCSYCRNERHLDYGRAFSLYLPPVDKMIHHLKYSEKKKLADFFGLGMANVLSSDYYLKRADGIVPVPLFWWKSLRRGYNQSSLLADVISKECGIKVSPLLRRIKNTKTQTKLDQKERRENVHNAFIINGDVKDKRVVIIDDVMTTGATIKECARILKEAGAKAVYSLVAAITPA